MMWTIVPPEIIWQPSDEPPLTVRRHSRGYVVVRADRDGRPALERLIATDPALYLDPALQPGGPLP